MSAQNEPPTAYCGLADTLRIKHWIYTGRHIITTDSNKRKGVGVGSISVRTHDEPYNNTVLSSSSAVSSTDQLVGHDHDLLVPNDHEIKHTFSAAHRTWHEFVFRAKSIPATCMPRGTCDPSIMLKDVPALPEQIPQTFGIEGAAVWRIEIDNKARESRTNRATGRTSTDDLNLERTYGLGKGLSLLTREPVLCRISPTGHSEDSRGLGILTLCWSYILSMRLLEMQQRQVWYSPICLQPTPAATYTARSTDVVIDLRAASPSLVRWLCAVLAPGLGWCVKGYPPVWATRNPRDTRFVILTDGPAALPPNECPPNSLQASELLIEICDLFALGAGCSGQNCEFELLPVYTAAFLAALALPFYRCHNLEPRLAVSSLERSTESIETTNTTHIRQYVADLRYYMTLSADVRGVESIIWSIFWQPDIQCNLVSPWLSGIRTALLPIITEGHMITLAKTFATRRPRVALWWFGIIRLGNPQILEDVRLWLETTEGRFGQGIAARSWSDITVSAWNGAPQSFWDQGTDSSYPNSVDLVTRADVLRCRFNLRLQSDHWNRSFSWRPFGHVRKEDVELDLWPWLECGHNREYLYWVWWVKKNGMTISNVQYGFRRDTGRFVDIYDDLAQAPAEPLSHDHQVIYKHPSLAAVGRMLSLSMEDVSGDVDEDIAAMPGFEKHRWQKHWRILPRKW